MQEGLTTISLFAIIIIVLLCHWKHTPIQTQTWSGSGLSLPIVYAQTPVVILLNKF